MGKRGNMLIPKQPHVQSEKHRKFISTLPCCVSGLQGHTQCAHIRSGQQAGLGRKPSDDRCVPLAWQQHSIQHQVGEEKYWSKNGSIERALELAKSLYDATGNHKLANEALIAFRSGK